MILKFLWFPLPLGAWDGGYVILLWHSLSLPYNYLTLDFVLGLRRIQYATIELFHFVSICVCPLVSAHLSFDNIVRQKQHKINELSMNKDKEGNEA